MQITANQVTVARLAALPFLGYTVYGDVRLRIWGVVVGALIGLTDSLDGYLARKQGVTILGSLLDPVADKVFVVVCYACYADRHGLPWWVAAAILSRELLVTVLRSTLEGRGRRLPSTVLAKAKTWVQMLGFGFVVLCPIIHLPAVAETAALAVVLAMTWLSALDYLVVGIRSLSAPDPDRWLHWWRFAGGALLPVIGMRAIAGDNVPSVPIVLVMCLEMGRGALDNFAAHAAWVSAPDGASPAVDLSWAASLWAEILLLGAALAVPSVAAASALALLATAVALAEAARAAVKFAREPSPARLRPSGGSGTR